LSAQWQI